MAEDITDLYKQLLSSVQHAGDGAHSGESVPELLVRQSQLLSVLATTLVTMLTQGHVLVERLRHVELMLQEALENADG